MSGVDRKRAGHRAPPPFSGPDIAGGRAPLAPPASAAPSREDLRRDPRIAAELERIPEQFRMLYLKAMSGGRRTDREARRVACLQCATDDWTHESRVCKCVTCGLYQWRPGWVRGTPPVAAERGDRERGAH